MSPSSATPSHPIVGPRQLVYENAHQRVCVVDVDFGSHAKRIYVNEHGTRTGVLFVRDGEVLLVSQYRMLPKAQAWEIPGGRIDEGESPEEGALREALEETGLRAKQLYPLVFFIPGLDTCDNPTHVFWCDEFACENGATHADPREIQGQRWVPFETCLNMVFERAILDVMTLTALLAWQALQVRNAASGSAWRHSASAMAARKSAE